MLVAFILLQANIFAIIAESGKIIQITLSHYRSLDWLLLWWCL